MLPNNRFSLFKKKALQELPLHLSATFLPLVVQGFEVLKGFEQISSDVSQKLLNQ